MPKKLTTEEFVAKARAVHGDRYGYDLVEYLGSHSKVQVVCLEHGVFEPSAKRHLAGGHCAKCVWAGQVLSTEAFIVRAQAVHGDKYDYSSTVYRRSMEKVSIRCKDHGQFLQMAGDHMLGRGCYQCQRQALPGHRRLSEQDVFNRCVKAHGGAYDYSQTKFAGSKNKMTIKCRQHGPFSQTAGEHMAGHGCPKCANVGPSKPELEILEFVRTLDVGEVESGNRTVIAPKEIDIYIPSKACGIEVDGVHYHNDLRKGKNYHRDKTLAAAAAGIRLIHITDIDWLQRRPQIERLLRNALGVSKDIKINARQTTVEQISIQEANGFLELWHPQGRGATTVKCFGLRHPEHGLCAVMTIGVNAYRRNPATAKVKHMGEFDLCRYTTSASVRGGASKLFKFAVKELGIHACQSFSSNDWFGGSLYPTLGFVKGAEIEPDYRVYHKAIPGGLRGKSTWRRANIPARLKQIGSDIQFDPETDKRTEWMIQNEVNAVRCWDAGKIRWHWKADTNN